ncbi:hypothetical protein GPECTOR_22g927 [Gonium pectorale]|uniref:ZIP protein n=1 Tax=Gonium pectorale TaxID=33097 RepID=A0A150GHS0_GONPE|nr:hypothetical protein GPECTOR_22g927 [Gonium pectorale]|eukprot:KXZ49333.1 hypothetical protein GPECTOR_22g927 [Gonium pectorale]
MQPLGQGPLHDYDDDSATLSLKGWAALVLLLEAAAGMYLPLLLQRLRSPQWWLSLLNCFSGGIFLAAGIIHLLPHCAEAQEALGPIGPHGDYPLYLVLVVVGYCVVFYVERVLFDVHGEGHTHCQHSNVFSHSSYYQAISHRSYRPPRAPAAANAKALPCGTCGGALPALPAPPAHRHHAHHPHGHGTDHDHHHHHQLEHGSDSDSAKPGAGPVAAVNGLALLPPAAPLPPPSPRRAAARLHAADHTHIHHHHHSPHHGHDHHDHGHSHGHSSPRRQRRRSLLSQEDVVLAAPSSPPVCSASSLMLAAPPGGAAPDGGRPSGDGGGGDDESCHSEHTPRAVCVCVEEEAEAEARRRRQHQRASQHSHDGEAHGHHGLHHHDGPADHHHHHHHSQEPHGHTQGHGHDAAALLAPLLGASSPSAPGSPQPRHRLAGGAGARDDVDGHGSCSGGGGGDTTSGAGHTHSHCCHHHHHHHHAPLAHHADHNHHHNHHHGADAQQQHVIKPRFRFMHGVVLLMALALHTALECVALGLIDDRPQFLLLFAAIASHKAVSALALSSRFLKEGASMAQVTAYVGPFCLVAPLSILAGVYVGRVAPIARLVFSCFATGTFLYVGASEVIMEEFEGEMRADRRDISTRAARYLKFGAVLAAVGLVAASGLLPEPDHH